MISGELPTKLDYLGFLFIQEKKVVSQPCLNFLNTQLQVGQVGIITCLHLGYMLAEPLKYILMLTILIVLFYIIIPQYYRDILYFLGRSIFLYISQDTLYNKTLVTSAALFLDHISWSHYFKGQEQTRDYPNYLSTYHASGPATVCQLHVHVHNIT